MLRMLAGFEEPDEGDLRIDGRPMVGVPPNRRPVNLVFQSYALFPHLTVFDNVAFGLRMRGIGSAEVRQAVRSALDMVRLQGKDARLPSQLSGGEQQRVALARALVNKPAVVLLDEPLAALDQQLRQEMQVELKAIQQRAGLTCVCVTHHQEEAMMMSDRIAVMQRGQMLQIGSPRDVYARPSNLFVARFLGVSNELTGRITRDGQGQWFYPKQPGLPRLSVDGVVQHRTGGQAVLSLRPEAVTMSLTRSSEFDNVLPGRIDKMLFAGSTVKCLVRIAPDSVWDITIESGGNRGERFEPGHDVFLHWAAAAAQVFGG